MARKKKPINVIIVNDEIPKSIQIFFSRMLVEMNIEKYQTEGYSRSNAIDILEKAFRTFG